MDWKALTAPRTAITGLLLLFFATLPFIADVLDEPFYFDLFARIMIFIIAAASLDFILGYGGMVSFGHAAYLGIGGYAVAVFSYYGIDNGFIQFFAAAGASCLIALFIGAISLRTGGVYFIMITLAFTQMLFYLGISIEEFGGDDGISTNRSEFFDALDLNDDWTFYYFVFAFLVATLVLLRRIVNSRFGMVIRASRSNDRRMRAIGFSTFRYRLVAFAISGTICGLAGALMVNQDEFLTPEVMGWQTSGEILVIVIMGGMGTIYGALFGTTAFLLMEEYLSGLTQHWLVFFGPFLILIVLFARGGIYSLLPTEVRALPKFVLGCVAVGVGGWLIVLMIEQFDVLATISILAGLIVVLRLAAWKGLNPCASKSGGEP